MSSVELLEIVSDDISIHRWRISGLQNLNRKNKLSSLPFWVPDPDTKKHQFRCVLIRGMVAKKEESDDWLGLIIEFIPPPKYSNAGCPGGCTITARVVNRVYDSNSHDVEQTKTASLTLDNLQLCFPELISPTLLNNPEFVEGDEHALLVELNIHTGVNVAAEWANKTITMMWSTLSSSVSSLVQKVSHMYTEGREEYGTHTAIEEDLPVPWEHVPENWVGREEAWRRLLTEQIVEDEGTFRYGPEKGFSKDEQALLLRCGITQRLVINAHSHFNYNRDVHKRLLEPPGIRRQRYNLVPGKIKEEVFWANYFWRVAALSLCTNDEQVRLLLTVLNAPPAVKPRELPAFKAVDKETVLERIKDAQEASDVLIEYLTDDTPDSDMLIDAAAMACEGHVRQLDGYFKRSDLSEETLTMIGAVLKRIRERLTKYREWKEKHGSIFPAVNLGIDSTINACTSDGGGYNDYMDDANQVVGTPKKSATSAVDFDPLTNRSNDKTDTFAEAPNVMVESVVVKADADPVGKNITFPLMPWEEDDDDEDGDEIIQKERKSKEE